MSGRRVHRAAVCVPVRNEAALLPHFLDALAAQRDAPAFVLCVLLDDCRDKSAAIVRARSPLLPFDVVAADVGSGPPNAGLARRRAMMLGLSMLGDQDDTMIVSTDADSLPATDWLAANMRALKIADVAAGRVLRSGGRASVVQDRVEAYLDSLFALRRTIDPVPWEASQTHHYASAASLAFRAGAYRALGGFEPVPSGEDGRLVDAAHRAGLRVRRDAAIHLETSARRDGRAAGGLADHLRQLDASAITPAMAHPEDLVWRYERHAAARAAWPAIAGERRRLAALLACDVAHVDRVAAAAVNAEGFATRVVPDVPGDERIVPLDLAETALAGLCDGRQALAA